MTAADEKKEAAKAKAEEKKEIKHPVKHDKDLFGEFPGQLDAFSTTLDKDLEASDPKNLNTQMLGSLKVSVDNLKRQLAAVQKNL